MKIKDRQKICSHCEGRIAVEADSCIYCGMPLVEERSLQGEGMPEGVNSLYPPPYSVGGSSHLKTDREFTGQFKSAPKTASGEIALPQESSIEEKQEEGSKDFMAILLALLGSNLFILGIMQGFFSEGGFLRLEWNAQYWFILCLLSLPMLYFGVRKK